MPTKPNDEPLSLNNITPYFQVLVFKKENYDRDTFKKLIEERIEKSKKKNKTSKIKWETAENQIYAAWIETQEFPSWLETFEKIDPSHHLPINVENSLILINDTNTYLYVHASDKRTEKS